jgi:hypothetical protein
VGDDAAGVADARGVGGGCGEVEEDEDAGNRCGGVGERAVEAELADDKELKGSEPEGAAKGERGGKGKDGGREERCAQSRW